MLKQDVLSDQIYKANYDVLVDFFIKEGLTFEKANAYAHDIIIQYTYSISKKAIELCGEIK